MIPPSRWTLTAVLIAWTSVVLADELAYDNGEVLGSIAGLEAGQAEAMRLTPPHPATLRSLSLRFSKPGAVEIHLWGDNGGNQPDWDLDLIEPREAYAPLGGRVTIELTDPVELGPENHVHVGHVLLEDGGPSLLLDTSESSVFRAVYWQYSDTYQQDMWFAAASNVGGETVYRHFHVRAEVDYHDQVTGRRFVDVTEETGFGRPKHIAAVDFDGDGDVDAFMGGHLYRNAAGVFVDVSAEAGIPEVAGIVGGVFCDYDRDGDLDLFVFVNSCCNQEEAGGVHDLLLNNDGGVFVDVTETAGLFDYRPNRSAAWGDFDGDGYPDLFLPGYSKPGEPTTPTGNTLFRNNGDGTFTDATRGAMINAVPAQVSRTVTWADYDGDGWLDLYVGAYRLQPNYLFRNLGGYFDEVGVATGTIGIQRMGAYGHTIGAAWGDLDNDTDLDLVVMNLAHPYFLGFSDLSKIYLNPKGTGEVAFRDAFDELGIAYKETAYEPALGDFDNDGDLDLFQTNVYAGRESMFYANRLVEDGALGFEEVSYPTGARIEDANGAVWADFDGDGDLDLMTEGLFRNDGPVGNWLVVRLAGGEGQDTHGLGATVTVLSGDLEMTRLVSAGKGEGNQNPFALHFGLGDSDRYDSITVRWPGGESDVHPCGAGNQRLVLRQGELLDPPPEGCGEDPDGGSDAGIDAGVDAGSDAGPDPDDGAGGCGCRTSRTAALPFAMILLGFCLRRRV